MRRPIESGFAPAEAGRTLSGAEASDLVLVQLLGAALLGIGAASWVARRSLLGGIYGRAVVVGNQVFAFVGVFL